MDFIIGGLAGAGATVFTNPMDVVKTRLQLQGELKANNGYTKRYRGIFHAMSVIGKTDGVLALQKGLAPAMLFGFAMNSVRLGLYHAAEAQGWIKSKNGDISVYKAAFWSSTSGMLSGILSNPASVLKTRIQAAAHPSIAVGRQHQYDGMLHGFAKIYKTEGLRGYFAGVTVHCTRLAIGSAAQLTTFSTVKEWLRSHGVCAHSPFGLAFISSAVCGIAVSVVICPLDVITVRLYNQGYYNTSEMRSFIASLVCSVIVVVVETPLDVINTRLYNQGSSKNGSQLYTGVVDCLTKTFKTEGIYGLYKGIGPLYLRIAPHTTISLVMWDLLNNLLLN